MIISIKKHQFRYYFILFLGLLFFCCDEVNAEIIQVNISGVITEPPSCVINGGNTIDVDFGSKVMTNLVNGSNYLQKVTYSVTCKNSTSNSMRMKISGDTAGFSNTALKTSNDNLGIEFLLNGKVHSGWFDYTYPSIPKLEAVPIKRGGSVLETGFFDGTATLIVEFR
ncbi:exported pilin protein [Yersinia frederiksenii]|nr:exported pilin protein [Yersinia frederiksenii]